MKRFFKVFICVIALLAFLPSTLAYADNGSTIVYKTSTGECYHLDGCSYLKSRIEITLEKAVDSGLRPCSRCHPPVLISFTAPTTAPTPVPFVDPTSRPTVYKFEQPRVSPVNTPSPTPTMQVNQSSSSSTMGVGIGGYALGAVSVGLLIAGLKRK